MWLRYGVMLVEGSGMLNVWFVFTAATSLVGVGSRMRSSRNYGIGLYPEGGRERDRGHRDLGQFRIL